MTSPLYRRRRLSKPNLESLDDRIVPSAAGSAIHAQALEARAEHVAEVRAERLQRMEIRAEHMAEVRAERAQQRELRLEHRAELRAARLQRIQAQIAAMRAVGFNANFGPNAIAFRGAFAQGRAVTPANTAMINQSIAASPATATAATVPTSTTLSASTNSAQPVAVGDNMYTTSATSTDVSDIKNGPLAKAGQQLIEVYTQYHDFNGSGDFTLTGDLANYIRIQGDSVGVDVGTAPSQMANVEATLKSLGMQITATDATTGTIEGYLPIAQLPTVAQDSNVLTLSPNYLPVLPPPSDPSGGIRPH